VVAVVELASADVASLAVAAFLADAAPEI